MSILLLVMTDGRDDVLAQTIESARDSLQGPITHRVIHTDNGVLHRESLKKLYPDFHIIGGPRRGFGGAIHRAWSYVLTQPQSYVFHLEDDFLFNRPVPLDDMCDVLDLVPNVHQLCLRRQPWNEAETRAGGIIEQWPDEYTDVHSRFGDWLEHRLFFSTNPSLYRSSLCQRDWPRTERSEAKFSQALFEDPNAVCAFWGSRHSGEWVHHIGLHRAGTIY